LKNPAAATPIGIDRRQLGFGVALIAGSLLLGAAVAAMPPAAVGLAFGAAALVLGLRNPEMSAAVGLLLLAIGTPLTIGESVWNVDSEPIRKGLLILFFVPAALRYWVDLRLLAPLVAYALLGLMTLTLSEQPALLTNVQIAESFVTVGLGWSLLAIRWPRRSARVLLQALALLPLASVLLGGVLAVFGLGWGYSPSGGTGAVPRLGGATSPPQLAFLAIVGISASIVSSRLFRYRYATALAILNALILALTVTRGSMAAGLILAVPVAVRYLRGSAVGIGLRRELRVLILLFVLAAAAAAVAPAIVARSSSYTEAGQINTSGREAAWEFFWDQAHREPVFGRGLGSGPVIDVPDWIERGDFTAQHNEYLRLFLEGGYVGFAIVLAAIVLTIALVARRFPRRVAGDLWALVGAFTLLSFVDNTLSAPEFAVAFAVLLGSLKAWGEAEVREPSPAR
jgi:O-antigen ligase